MTRLFRLRRVVVAASLALPMVAFAQATTAKPAPPPPRLPPPPSQTSADPERGRWRHARHQRCLAARHAGDVEFHRRAHRPRHVGRRPRRGAAEACGEQRRLHQAADVEHEDNKATPAALPKAGLTGKATPPAAPAKPPVARGATRIDC